MELPHAQMHRHSEDTAGERGITRLKRAFMRPGEGPAAEEGGAEIREIFSRILLFATIFTPLPPGEDQANLERILKQNGLVLERSDCLILEQCRIGNSRITIARYSLQYRNEDEPGGRVVCLEGNLAMQTDHLGQVSISISAKPWASTGADPFGSGTRTGGSVPARNLS